MIRRFIQTFCAALAAISIVAGPLDLNSVPKDVKWLVHLDAESFRRTKIGNHVVKSVLQPKVDEAEEVKKMNLSISLENISSLTAFGSAFEKRAGGVLLVRTSADVKKDLDTLCGIASLSGGNFLTLTQLNPYPLYAFKSSLFIAPAVKGTAVIAKSREEVESARQLLLGKGESLAVNGTFNGYPLTTNTFFFLGMAEGFNEHAAIPPQAQVLKETRGGRLVLGEKGDKLFANLVLKGKDDEATLKIQQVFQGIVALVTLSQENKELAELANAARISAEGRNVSIDLQFPISKAIQHLDEEIAD